MPLLDRSLDPSQGGVAVAEGPVELSEEEGVVHRGSDLQRVFSSPGVGVRHTEGRSPLGVELCRAPVRGNGLLVLPQPGMGPAQEEEAPGKVGVQLESLPGGGEGLVVVTHGRMDVPDPDGGQWIEGVQLLGSPHLRHRLLLAPEEVEIEGVVDACPRQVGVQLQGALEGASRALPVPLAIELRLGDGRVGFGEGVVELESLPVLGLRSAQGIGGSAIGAVALRQAVAERQAGVCQRAPRIRCHGLLQVR